MSELKRLVRNVGPKLIPFIKAVIIYFLVLLFKHNQEIWTTVLKCAPIVCLMIFVLLHGMKLTNEYRYAQNIFVGLIFSCCGDALLNLNMFAFGMLAFGVAQVFYISAFGWRPLRLWIGFILYIFGAVAIFFLYKNIDSIVLRIGLPIYALLLLTMSWRALARINKSKTTFAIINDVCAFASILFVLSDSIIAFDEFYAPIPHRTILVMATYYLAQFGIAFSIVNYSKKSEIYKSVHSQTSDELDSSDSSNNLSGHFKTSIHQRRFSDK